MKRYGRILLIAVFLALALGVTGWIVVSLAQPDRVREPAVAGLFYPKEPTELGRVVGALLEAAPPKTIHGELRGLVVPHAGYPYSGLTAAVGYRLLFGRELDTVIVLAPSHNAVYKGAYIPEIDIYRTPLGDVKVSSKSRKLAKLKPFVLEAPAQVMRPQWAAQSSRPLPPDGADTPDTWEHSGEVQVPFLQKTLGNFEIVPVVMREADIEQTARALESQLDSKTLIVASSDLSHYHPYETARQMDDRCVRAIVSLDVAEMQKQEACGGEPILTLMHLAKLKGWKTKLLDCRNSGDTAGDKQRVVGYAAIAFYEPAPQTYTGEERKHLLQLARGTLKNTAANNSPPLVPVSAFPKLGEARACFVTLTKHGALRGCIGNLQPQGALLQAVVNNTQSAAMRDTRFTPVKADEFDAIEIEISVLTLPEKLDFRSPEDLLKKLKPHRDGVILQVGSAGSTYLPQVWEQIPDKEAFMNSLAQKAGLTADAWRKPEAVIHTYRVESFSETDH